MSKRDLVVIAVIVAMVAVALYYYNRGLDSIDASLKSGLSVIPIVNGGESSGDTTDDTPEAVGWLVSWLGQ